VPFFREDIDQLACGEGMILIGEEPEDILQQQDSLLGMLSHIDNLSFLNHYQSLFYPKWRIMQSR